MLGRLALPTSLLAALYLTACGSTHPAAGAAKATLEWQQFEPGCLTLAAESNGHKSDPTSFAITDGARDGSRTVAVYRGDGWGNEVTLTARATEGSCADGKVVAEVVKTVSITRGVAEVTLTLTAADVDQDGFVDASAQRPGTDCNDAVATVHPGAAEACNAVDDDCDGTTDEDVGTAYFADTDQDGFGNPAASLTACAKPSTYVENSSDCDDGNPEVRPGAAEVCNAQDDNCDGNFDEGFAQNPYFRDQDSDGHGDPAKQVTACGQPTGYVTSNDDCDDGAATVFTGAAEVCNGADDDCDNVIDDGVDSAYFRDQDSDGYGDSAQTTRSCSQPQGYVTQGGDCGDQDAAVYPGNPETCDLKDNNCDGTIDEGVKTTFFQDADLDGHGGTASTEACTAPNGYVATSGDCNDSSNAVKPGATELCNNVDDDCDTQVDEGVQNTYYRDADLDTYGSPTQTTQACMPPSGYVTNADDCNDAAPAVKPGATESCNNVDDDCDGSIDEGVTSTFYADVDGDGFGDPGSSVQACTAGNGASSNSNDCDDGNPYRYNGASEVCDQLDNDCDGTADDGITCTNFAWKTPANAGGGNEDWRRVAPFDRNKAYAIGYEGTTFNSKLRAYDGLVRTDDLNGDCAGRLYSGWADPITQIVHLGLYANTTPATSYFTTHKVGTNTCGTGTLALTLAAIRGIVGFRDPVDGPILYGATSGGQVLVFKPNLNQQTAASGTTATDTYWDIDGTDEQHLLVVGNTSATRPVILERNGTATFAAATLPSTGLPTGNLALRAVSLSRSGYAMAVGDQGLVLARTKTGPWTVVASPPNATNLLGVKVFGPTLAYAIGATASTHELWRWNGTAWTALPASLPTADAPRDIDGLTPDDLWVAGDNGLLLHWDE